ncbi:ABC transporter permease [Arthrobacter sp. zg-Y750]|uniref:ABC transporter permease n=1 Tax=Arthrobacter sp. zg-Y750 TaxID=2894189 RepID=UPI001E484703|nr:ABC transporter permease [Arthrobacter sp. zg-Y750]MCC9176095.1 ABC transporter permease [Arthrobacter sp. zg-Y750]
MSDPHSGPDLSDGSPRSTELVLAETVPATGPGAAASPAPDAHVAPPAARHTERRAQYGRRGSVPDAGFWRSLGAHILIPFFLAAGMGLAYLGAFHEPEPRHLAVAVVGTGAQAEVFAQRLNDSAPDKLDVRTVPDAGEARRLITDRDISVAYETGSDDATLYVSTAGSATTAEVAKKIFLPLAYESEKPLQVVDVVPTNEHDPTSQGLFFLLVAMSVGGYSSAVAISAVAGRISVLWRAAVALASSAVIAAMGVIIAGPVYGVIEHSHWGIWLLTWLYVATITLLGVAMYPMLRKWTTPTLTLLFVMLNFTSSGGIFTFETVPPFFAALGSFWNGAAWLHAAQGLVYFPGQAFGTDLLKLAIWLAAGAGLLALTHLWSVRRTRLADELARAREDEEGLAA